MLFKEAFLEPSIKRILLNSSLYLKQFMMIILTVYIIIISIIIFKGFYKSIFFIKSFSVKENTESISISIQIESLPFYFNQGKINLFAFFINFFLISLISCMLIPELISNNIAYCQDYDERINGETRYITNGIFSSNRRILFDKSIIIETYDISNTNRPFIYHLNYKYIGIQDHLKVFQGLSQNIEDISNKQNFLIQKIPFITRDSYILSEIYKEIYQKSFNTLSLISNAYKNIMFSYENYEKNNLPLHHSDKLLNKILHNKILLIDKEGKFYINKIIRDFIGYYPIENLNQKTIDIFASLEKIQQISEKNLMQRNQLNSRIISFKIINSSNELSNFCHQNLLLILNRDMDNSNQIAYGLKYNNSMDIHRNINNYHSSMNEEKTNFILDEGFFFKEKPILLDIDDDYEPFDMHSTDENILKEYQNLIEMKKFMDKNLDQDED